MNHHPTLPNTSAAAEVFFFSIFIISSFLYIYLSFLLSYTGYILNYAVRRRTASQPAEGNQTSKWFLLAAVRLLLPTTCSLTRDERTLVDNWSPITHRLPAKTKERRQGVYSMYSKKKRIKVTSKTTGRDDPKKRKREKRIRGGQ